MMHLKKLYLECKNDRPIPEPQAYWGSSGLSNVLENLETYKVSTELFKSLK
jgi:hypothetical protein